jgi:hypothetical protein
MLKKMLKGLLAIATVCAMSSFAYAGDATVSGYGAASFGSKTEGDTTTWYESNWMQITAEMKAESVSSKFTIDAKDGTVGEWAAYVDWSMTDSVTMSIGSMSKGLFAQLGSIALRQADFNIPNLVISGAPGLFAGPGTHAIQFAIGIGDAGDVYAGIFEGDDMTMYGIYEGKFGDLKLIAGMRTAAADGDANTALDVDYKIGDSMEAALNYAMAGDLNQMGLAFWMNDLGPGNLAVIYKSAVVVADADATTAMGLKYAYKIAPGANLEILYTAQGESDSYFGVTLGGGF